MFSLEVGWKNILEVGMEYCPRNFSPLNPTFINAAVYDSIGLLCYAISPVQTFVINQFLSTQRLPIDTSPFLRTYSSFGAIDCRILETSLFRTRWYIHKFSAPCLRYKVTTTRHSGNIVWEHGPFPFEEWSDLKSFKSR